MIAAEVVELAQDPFGDGSTFAQVLAYGGKLMLAPRQDGRSVTWMNRDGSGSGGDLAGLPRRT